MEIVQDNVGGDMGKAVRD